MNSLCCFESSARLSTEVNGGGVKLICLKLVNFENVIITSLFYLAWYMKQHFIAALCRSELGEVELSLSHNYPAVCDSLNFSTSQLPTPRSPESDSSRILFVSFELFVLLSPTKAIVIFSH